MRSGQRRWCPPRARAVVRTRRQSLPAPKSSVLYLTVFLGADLAGRPRTGVCGGFGQGESAAALGDQQPARSYAAKQQQCREDK